MNKLFAVISLALWSAAALAQTPADVTFMQGMIAHHGQALTMAGMVPGRSSRTDFGLMAERIIVSQRDEIAFMQRWLKKQNAAVPMLNEHPDHGANHDMGAEHAQHHADSAMHHALTPGMLTADELAQLGNTTGAAFEKLFLASMIRHHEGAIAMVRGLFATQGAGQDQGVFRFASEVDGDQRAEITRMQTLLRDMK